jgi:hypothetical protein
VYKIKKKKKKNLTRRHPSQIQQKIKEEDDSNFSLFLCRCHGGPYNPMVIREKEKRKEKSFPV